VGTVDEFCGDSKEFFITGVHTYKVAVPRRFLKEVLELIGVKVKVRLVAGGVGIWQLADIERFEEE